MRLLVEGGKFHVKGSKEKWTFHLEQQKLPDKDEKILIKADEKAWIVKNNLKTDAVFEKMIHS